MTLIVTRRISTKESAPPVRIAQPTPPAGFPKFTEFENVPEEKLSHDDAMVHAGYFMLVDDYAFYQRYRKKVASRFVRIGLASAFPPAVRGDLNACNHLRSIFVDDLSFHDKAILAWGTYADSCIKAARPSQRPAIIESFGFLPGFFQLHEPTNMPMTAIAAWGMIPDNKGFAYSQAMDWLAEHGDLNRYKHAADRPFETRPGVHTESLFAESPDTPHTGRHLLCFGIPLLHDEAERLIRLTGCVPGSFRDLIRHITPELIVGRKNPAYPREREPERIGGIVSGAPIVALSPVMEQGVPCFSATSGRGVTLDFASLGGGGFPANTRFMALVVPPAPKKTRRSYEMAELPGTTRDDILL